MTAPGDLVRLFYEEISQAIQAPRKKAEGE